MVLCLFPGNRENRQHGVPPKKLPGYDILLPYSRPKGSSGGRSGAETPPCSQSALIRSVSVNEDDC